MLTEVFLTFLVSSLCGFFVIIAKLTYKSKCRNIKCCCIEIERNVEEELKIDELQIQNVTNSKSDNNLNNI